METIKIAIVDDHKMLSGAIEKMLSINKKYKVINTSSNGEEFIEALEDQSVDPDVVLMDVNMPVKNGVETTQHLKDHFPAIKVIALTMEDDEKTIIAMLKAGARGYLLKEMSPKILFEAIDTVYEKGVFYTDTVTQCLLNIRTEEKVVKDCVGELKDREKEFIKLACSEMTYKEIADVMFLSPKTIDGYRDSVFIKLDVKSRVGLVLFAIKHQLN